MAEKVSPCDEHIPNLLSPFLLFCYQVATGFLLSRSLSLTLTRPRTVTGSEKFRKTSKQIEDLWVDMPQHIPIQNESSAKREASAVPRKDEEQKTMKKKKRKCVYSIKFAFVVERPFPTQSRKLLWAPMYVSCLDDCISLAYLAPLYPCPSHPYTSIDIVY